MNASLVVSSYRILLDGKPTRHSIVSRGHGRWTANNGESVLSSASGIDDAFRQKLHLKDGQNWVWEHDPLPSWREDEFLLRTRFDSYTAALTAFQEWFEFAQPWEITRAFED